MKIKYLLIIGFLFLITPTLIFAASSDFLTKAQQFYAKECNSKASATEAIPCYVFDKVHELESRLALLESKPTPTPITKNSFYTKIFGSYPVNAGGTQTIVYGCEDNDVAVGGGMYTYSGPIKNWRTVRSAPAVSTENAHAWEQPY